MQTRSVHTKEEMSLFRNILGSVALAYIVTIGLLLLLSILLFTLNLPKSIVLGGTIFIYVVATFVGGFRIGKKMGNKKYLRGMVVGAMYFVILVIISLIGNGGEGGLSDSIFTTMILCVGGGMLGGMVS